LGLEYMNDLEEEYQARALLAKSKRFFKNDTQRFSSAKATYQTECHTCGNKGHFARDCWSKTSVPSYQSPFQPKLLYSSEHKPEPRHTKDFEAKYNKVKAKLAPLKVSFDDNEVTEVKALMALADEERVSVGKESARYNTPCFRILKENQNLRNELKELTSITEAWLNSSNKVNRCIREQIPTQKKKILGIDQFTEDTSNSGTKDPVFVKASVDNSKASAGESSSRSRPSRLAIPFPSFIHCGYNDHKSDDCVYYPICEICGSYDHDIRYQANPKESHLIAVKRTFCTLSLGFQYPKRSGFDLKGYSDSDCARCNMDRKSTSAEAKDVAAAGCCANILWIKSQVTDYDIIYEKIKNHTLKRDIEFHFISTKYQLADIFIKILDKPSFKKLIDELVTALENSKVSFSIPTSGIFGEVGVNTFRNAIGAHYPAHFSEYVATPSIDVVRSPNMYKEYIAEFWYSATTLENSKVSFSIPTSGIYGEVGLNTFRNAIGAHYLPHSNKYVAPPSIDVVRQWFPTIGYGEEVSAKGTLRKSLSPPRWSKEATKGGSSKAPTSSKTGHSKKRKEFRSAMDSNPSQPPVSTHVDTGMHKEDQQATGGPTSVGVTSEERANPKLSSGMSAFNLNKPIFSASFIIHSESASRYDASADSTTKANPRLSVPNDSTPQQLCEGLETILTQPIIGKESQKHKQELEKNKAEVVLLKAQPTFPNVGQLNELLVKSLQSEFSNILPAHDFSSSLPTKLKDLLSKFNELTEEVKGLKKQVRDLKIELPGDLKEIPSKLEDFTKTVTGLTSQVVELKTLQWELLAEFLSLPVLDSTSSKARDQSVPSAGQADTMPAEGEKNTNQSTISQLFHRRAEKNAPLNLRGEHIKKDKGKKAMSSEEAEKESTNSDSNDDDETHVTGSMVEPSTTKKLKKFDFITEDGRHIHLTKEEINHQKKLEEDVKAEAAKQEGEVRKVELVDLLGLEVVN
ncbi:pleiotropic drug resistance protein 1-like protein, partial [Tanacetum coccineum]